MDKPHYRCAFDSIPDWTFSQVFPCGIGLTTIFPLRVTAHFATHQRVCHPRQSPGSQRERERLRLAFVQQKFHKCCPPPKQRWLNCSLHSPTSTGGCDGYHRDRVTKHHGYRALDKRTSKTGFPLVLPACVWANPWAQSRNHVTGKDHRPHV